MTPPTKEPSHRSQVRTVLTVGLLSGLAGSAMLAQDTVLAYYFGTSSAVDAYQLAVSVPSLLVNVLAGGTLLAVLVPELTRLTHHQANNEVTNVIRYARRSVGGLLAASALAWPVLYSLLEQRSNVDLSAAPHTLTIHLLWLITPILFFVGVTGIETAYLNSQKRFFNASIFPAFAPIGAILFTILFSKTLHIYATAIGTLCGSICLWLLGRHLTHRSLLQPYRDPQPAASKSVNRHYFLNVISSATLAGVILTDILLASSRPQGELATYNYATRPVIFVIALLTVSIGNVILPTFSRLATSANKNELIHHFRRWLVIAAAISLLVLATWVPNCATIVSLLYERGAFHSSDAESVTAIQTVYLLQLPFYAAAVIGVRLLNSLRHNRTLALINLAAFFTNLAVDSWLLPSMGLRGIALGTVTAFAVWAIMVIGCSLRAARHPQPQHTIDT